MEIVTLDIATPHGSVPAVAEVPTTSVASILLAHGAGAGQRHVWMTSMRSALAAQGLTTITFDYAYTAAGRKAPDRLPKLLDVHEAVGVQIAERFGELVLAGKSMGGRVGGHLVAERGFGALGVVYYGYPLLPIGASDPRSTDHLAHIDNPQLFVSGDRDRMGPIEAIRAVADSVPDGRVLVIEGGDHSLKPLKSTGRDLEASIRLAAGATAAMAAGSAGTGR